MRNRANPEWKQSRRKPVLDVGRAVAKALRGFQPRAVHKGGASDLRNQFFLAVSVGPKEGGCVKAVQALGVAGAVNHLMEGGPVILCGLFELFQEWERDGIGCWPVEGAVPFDMLHADTFTIHVTPDDGFRSGVSACGIWVGLHMLCGDPFALADVEDVVIAKEGDLLDLAGLFVFLVDPLPEDHHAGLLALADVTAFGVDLLVGQELASLAKQHLIQKAVGLAGGVTDGAACGHPRLLPRDDSLFHFGYHAVGDLGVNIHFLCSLLLWEQGFCGRINLAPDGLS